MQLPGPIPLAVVVESGGHAWHVAFVALVLPRGPNEPSVQGEPAQVALVPAAVVCVPLGQGTQKALQIHRYVVLQAMGLLTALNLRPVPSLAT